MIDETQDRLGMTEEEWARFQEHTRGYGYQDENGVDITLLLGNLELTPTERVLKSIHFGRVLEQIKAARANVRPRRHS